MTTKEIEELLEKFYRGETSLKEEAMLREHLQKEPGTNPAGEIFAYFEGLSEVLNAKATAEQPLVFNVPSSESSGKVLAYRIAASIALLITGFLISSLYYEYKSKDQQIVHMREMLNVYQTVISNSNMQFFDRVSIMHSLIESNPNDLDFLVLVLTGEDDIHVKIQSIRLITKQYGSEVSAKVLTRQLDNESRVNDRIAMLKLLLELNPEEALIRIDELLKNKTIDDETKKAIETLKL